jgi:hypothetical protein
MTAFPSRRGRLGHVVTLQFLDEAHADFYALGKRAQRGCPSVPRLARALRDRMLPFMDLSDAHSAAKYAPSMGGRERRALRADGFIAADRFTAWAQEFADQVDELATCGACKPISLYDPERLLRVLAAQARANGATRHRVFIAA